MKKTVSAFCLIALSFSAAAADPVAVKPPPQKVLSSDQGRYVFGQISDFRKDQFLLDTKTGRLWKMMYDATKDAPSADGQAVLIPVLVQDVLGQRSAEPAPTK